MKASFPSLEVLESRIAPAAVFTFTDVDGDAVTITTSKGANADLAAIVTLAPLGAGMELQRIDFSGDAASFVGTALSVTARRTSLGGDGRVNVGYIDATDTNGGTALDLGRVTIKGDLGQIDAGDATTATAAVKGLSVQSIGRFGTSTQSPGGHLVSTLNGALGYLKVAGDLKEAVIDVSGGADGKIGPITIGGSVIGGPADSSGRISSTGVIGAVKIGGNIEGGSGRASGRLHTTGRMASVTIGGSFIGGSDDFSGEIFSQGAMGAVKIGGNIEGGSGAYSGRIMTNGALASVTIGGSLLGGSSPGGTNTDSGRIFSAGAIGEVWIGGDIRGGSGRESGQIQTNSTLASLNVGGSILGGSNANSGQVWSVDAMGAVKVGGNIEGGSGESSGSVLTFGTSGTLASVTVGGSLIGGSNTNAGRIFSIRAMGAVKIGGNIEGGSGLRSGQLATDSTLASLRLGGSLLGGSEDSSGQVRSVGAMGGVKIGGNIEGGDIGAPGTLSDTGFIEARRIASLVVGGSIISGTESGGGTLINSGAVRVGADLGSITIKGSIIGNVTNPVLITARGQDTPGATTDVAIKSLTVRGRVEFADILAGYSGTGTPVGRNADAQIGKVVIDTDWIASNLVAGVQDDGDAGRDDSFGEGDDQKIAGGTDTAARISKIASVVIKGQALGTVGPGDHFGILAQRIGSFKIGATVFPLHAGVGNDLPGLPIGVTGAPAGDLRVREVAL